MNRYCITLLKDSLGVATYLTWSCSMAGIAALLLVKTASSQELPAAPSSPGAMQVVVNGHQDGMIAPDTVLTLREAIALVNGTLALDQLSPAEKAQVKTFPAATSRIEFALPAGETTILLTAALPALSTPGLTIDGTTQPGYGATAETIPAPLVTIAPQPQTEILRGLTITADQVTIRGLSLYGFTALRPTNSPAADIFISHAFPAANSSPNSPSSNFPDGDRTLLPQGVVIEDNWLGLSSANQTSTQPYSHSAFGVSVFNAVGTVIQRNRIANHDGSGILTSVRAENTLIRENVIENNGLVGMPDAIRLEGVINGTQVESNQISGNAGSGVFLFKPEGSVIIQDNQITSNGRRLQGAAIYLLGSGHQVNGNLIQDQPGAGVVVGAYPRSDRNLIQHNRFARLEGLSIDLNAQLNVGVNDFRGGDGVNPPRNSPNRRLETGNAAINAPRFLSSEFLILNGKVNIDGIADPNSQIELYRVEESGMLYGSLSEAIATTQADTKGRFSFTLDSLKPGDRVSAIATDPRYGTSEPALNVIVRSATRSMDNP